MPFDLATARPVQAANQGGFDLSTARPVDQASQPANVPHGTSQQSSPRPNALQILKETIRSFGKTGKNLAEGALALPGMVTDAPATIYEGVTGNQAPSYAKPYQSFVNALESPELADRNGGERIISNVERGMGGIVGGGAIGQALKGTLSPIARSVGASLQASRGMQTAGAITASISAEAARAAGGGPVAQTIAGMAGAMVPGAAMYSGQALLRGAVRGAEPGPVAENIQSFKAAGTTPTVGQATESGQARAIESFLSRVPGGAGPVANKARAQAEEIGAGLERQANTLAPKSTPQKTGLAIERGIEGEGGFLDQGKGMQKKLYDELDAYFPEQRPVKVDNTKAILKSLTDPIEGAKSLSRWFQNSKIRGIYGDFLKDTGVKTAQGANPIDRLKAAQSLDQLDATAADMRIGQAESPTPQQIDLENAYFDIRSQMGKAGAKSEVLTSDGRLPYEAVKKLRTLVGSEMNNAFEGKVSRDQWSPIYATLSKDIESAVSANPAAKQAWSRANNYTRAFHERAKLISSVLEKSGGPEAVYKSATSGTKDGATVLRGVMQSLPADAQKQLAATVVRKLGEATPGQVGTFSNERLLTNWRSLSPEARRTLVNRFDGKTRAYMDNLEKVTTNLREGSKVFANPSGTAGALNLKEGVGGAAAAALTGHPLVAAGIVSGMGGANLLARGMMNPSEQFINFLGAKTAAPNPQLNQLAVQSQQRR